MTGWTPDVSERELIVAIVIQGGGMGLVFSPLQVLAFATLPPAMRTEGASLFSLLRNIGAAIGVSVTSSLLAHNSQALHEMIGASVTPFNRTLQMAVRCVNGWTRDARRRGAAGSHDQPAGPDRRLRGRLRAADRDDIAGAAVAASHADAAQGGGPVETQAME